MKNIKELYNKLLDKYIKKSQENNSISESFSYSFNGSNWMLIRPRSVMEQVRLIDLMRKYLDDENDFETQKELIKAACANSMYAKGQSDKQVVNPELISYEELVMIERNYIDWILLPLFLAGQKALEEFMAQRVEKI